MPLSSGTAECELAWQTIGQMKTMAMHESENAMRVRYLDSVLHPK
ncbi:MAG: hypothetical protein ABLQ96_00300 [Candidatus Acidiferrum sp.]